MPDIVEINRRMIAHIGGIFFLNSEEVQNVRNQI